MFALLLVFLLTALLIWLLGHVLGTGGNDHLGILGLSYEEVVVDRLLSLTLDLAREWTRCKSICASLCSDLLLVNTTHGIHVILDVALGRIEILAASLTLDLEAKDLWLVVVDFWRQNHSLLLVLQEMVRERSAKVRTVDVDRAKLWDIDLLAPWAVHFESGDLQLVAQADW